MSTDYHIAESDTFRKLIGKHQYAPLYSKIVDYVYPQLRRNPFFGSNIKKLKGNLSSVYRYRIGDYRLIYTIDNGMITIFIMSISTRKDAY